jgi:hypothetical protein
LHSREREGKQLAEGNRKSDIVSIKEYKEEGRKEGIGHPL